MREKKSGPVPAEHSAPSAFEGKVLKVYYAVKPDLLFYRLALVFAFAGKLFYSLAGARELLFLLGPVTFLISAFTGMPFTYDETIGYVNHLTGIVIGKSCAGMNYLILLYAMTVISFIKYFKRTSGRLLFQCAALAVSYLLCVYATAARIVISIPLVTAVNGFPFLKSETAHKIIGIVVYSSTLLLYYGITDYFLKKAMKKNSGPSQQQEEASCKP